jgi:penicillin G amidase
MFAGGPASRFVATIKPNGIEAVSSLPGGDSGVRGNQFNLNLLPGWLTNDTFPLRMDEKPRGDSGRGGR